MSSSDPAIFVLEKLKLRAEKELLDRVEKHMRDIFNHRILPGIMKDVRANLIIDIVNEHDILDIKIHLREE